MLIFFPSLSPAVIFSPELTYPLCSPLLHAQRRRMQVLIAQRAYRSRKEVTLLNYQDRIVKLEGIVRNMNSLVQSFGEQQLARAESDALVSPAELASSLRNTMEACASMARGADQDTLEDDDSHSQSHIHRGGDPSSSSLPIQEEACAPAPPTNSAKQSRTTPTRSSSPGRFLKDLMVLQSSPSGVPSFDSVSAAVVPVQLSAFIEHLRVACVYHAYTALSNPGIAFESIRNKFRFLLSLMNRERLTSYFKAALEARVNQSGLRKEWEGIPFFGVGGAGSHYAQNRAPSSSGDGEEERTQSPWPLVKEPLSKLPTQAREDMDGDWFDVRDLEGFLRERQVRLTAYSSKVHQHRTVMGGVDVASLLQGMFIESLTARFERR